MTAPTLSIPIDVLTVAELETIQARLVRLYMTGDNAGSIVVEGINMIRRELNERKRNAR